MIDLVSMKSPEDERREAANVLAAEIYLRKTFGIEVCLEYGYFRNIYDILKELGERVIAENKVSLTEVNEAQIAAMREE